MEDTLQVTIIKPIQGTSNYVSIDFRKLKQAVAEHKMLKVTIVESGITSIVDPHWFFDTRKKDEKKKINYKTPMRFIYNFVPVEGAYKNPPINNSQQLSLL